MIAWHRCRPAFAVSLLLLLQPVRADSPPGCDEEDGECPATGMAAIQARASLKMTQGTAEEATSGTEVMYHNGAQIIVHADSEVKKSGSGRWVITIESGCTDADVAKMAEHMPAGTTPVYEGKPDEGGLCMFVMTGTKEQVMEELDTHSWPATPLVETDKTWKVIPEFPADDAAFLELHAGSRGPPSWGLDRIDDRSGLDSDYAPPGIAKGGAGAHVYVMDTGIRTTHSDFGGRAIPTLEIVGNGVVACQASQTNCAYDNQGHGTHCAGTVGGTTYGVAPASTIHAVKVLSDSGSGSFSWLLEAVDWVLQNGPKPGIASMSLGARADISSVTRAITQAVNSGLTVVVAAGNEGQSDVPDACSYSPAGIPAAITVGSTTRTDSRSGFSNIGSCVDIFAPGSSIISASHRSDSGSAGMSGTSMACPHVAGAAALILGEDLQRTPQQIVAALTSRSTTGAISDVGRNSPNKLLYTEAPAPGPSTTLGPTPAPTPAPATCGFEDPADGGVFCATWRQSTSDSLDWTRRSGGTPSSHTGPDSAASGSYYVYVEASSPASSGQDAILTSTSPVTLAGASLSFMYHMQVTDAILEVKVGGTSAWKMEGNQGSTWKRADIDLSTYGSGAQSIAFVYTRGGAWMNDVAIDDVTLAASASPPATTMPPQTTLPPTPAPTPSPTPAPTPYPTPYPTPAPTPSPTPMPTPEGAIAGPPGPPGPPGPQGPPGPPGPAA